jgi:ASC-1-like (ASCH) protein
MYTSGSVPANVTNSSETLKIALTWPTSSTVANLNEYTAYIQIYTDIPCSELFPSVPFVQQDRWCNIFQMQARIVEKQAGVVSIFIPLW